MSDNQQQLNQASQRVVQNRSSITAGRQQYGGAAPFKCNSETNVKTRYSSSHSVGQTQSNIQTNTTPTCRFPADEDVDIDGPPTEDFPAVHNLDVEELYDFRSTDGFSTGPPSPRDSIPLQTDDTSSTVDSVLTSQTSSAHGICCLYIHTLHTLI